MKQKDTGCSRPLAFLILAFLVLVGLWGVWTIDRIPRLAEESFGAANPALGVLDRAYYGAQILFNRQDLLFPMNPGDNNRLFEILQGESVNSVALRLEEEGFISDSAAFRNYLLYAGLDTGMKAGKYTLNAGMTAVDIAHTLQSAISEEVNFVLLPGWRAEEVAAAFSVNGLYADPAEFLRLVRNPPTDLLQGNLAGISNLEGFLYPGEYTFKRKLTAEAILRLMVDRFNMEVVSRLGTEFEKRGLSLNEAVTLASIVERESIMDDEMPAIASVFYNRLVVEMKLDSDPTVQYAIGYNSAQKTWWTNPLSNQDLLRDSSYNTYLYRGLPPGPICNPGFASLSAVAYPAETPYYYFRAKCDGSGRHNFAITYEEQLQNACP